MRRARIYFGIIAMFSGLMAIQGAEFAEQHGKTGTVLICILLGACCLFVGVIQLIEGSR